MHRYLARRHAILAVALVLLAGCVQLPRGTGLGQPASAPRPVDRRAWLARAEILDPAVEDRSTLEDSLTVNLTSYTRQAGLFRQVETLPGTLGVDDLVLRFRFDRYEQRRSPHPAYFPAAFLTATLYIWLGGPVFNDSSDLAGRLAVEDRETTTLADVAATVEERHSVSFWAPDYWIPSGVEARTRLVHDLLDKAAAELRRRENPS
ncbi:MAG TPA: hypothetical protein VKA21_08355 [Candidatus Binatia bacterium]|nr:hypothetical protein [Candidatus Binatia bacterium]